MDNNSDKIVFCSMLTAIATIAIAFLTAEGIKQSNSHLEKSLDLMQKQLEQEVKPLLNFKDGKYLVYLDNNNQPIDRKDSNLFPRMFFGKNYGKGPAKEAIVSFTVYPSEQNSNCNPIYRDEIRLSPSTLNSEDSFDLNRLPKFLMDDQDRILNKLEGVVKFRCEDINNGSVSNYQKVIIEIFYQNKLGPVVLFNFGES